MAFIYIYIYIFFLKKFEKVEKTGIIATKFSLRCTPSVILGVKGGKGDGQRMFDDFLVVSAKQIQKMTGQKVGSAERIEVMT